MKGHWAFWGIQTFWELHRHPQDKIGGAVNLQWDRWTSIEFSTAYPKWFHMGKLTIYWKIWPLWHAHTCLDASKQLYLTIWNAPHGAVVMGEADKGRWKEFVHSRWQSARWDVVCVRFTFTLPHDRCTLGLIIADRKETPAKAFEGFLSELGLNEMHFGLSC